MRIRRSLIIPAILAFGVASSLLAGPVMSAAAGSAVAVHATAAAAPTSPLMYYHG
jgi:hypothetical protein